MIFELENMQVWSHFTQYAFSYFNFFFLIRLGMIRSVTKNNFKSSNIIAANLYYGNLEMTWTIPHMSFLLISITIL